MSEATPYRRVNELINLRNEMRKRIEIAEGSNGCSVAFGPNAGSVRQYTYAISEALSAEVTRLLLAAWRKELDAIDAELAAVRGVTP